MSSPGPPTPPALPPSPPRCPLGSSSAIASTFNLGTAPWPGQAYGLRALAAGQVAIETALMPLGLAAVHPARRPSTRTYYRSRRSTYVAGLAGGRTFVSFDSRCPPRRDPTIPAASPSRCPRRTRVSA